MIKLEHVTKRYEAFTAVKELSLEVRRGELLVLLGPSGCGKSTTLRLINKMIERTEGSITIEGQDIDGFREEDLRRRIGYVIQSTGLFPHMNVYRNIATVPLLLKWAPKRIEERVHAMLDLVGLGAEQYAGKHPRELSGGEAQRVGVARALASDPDIVLMDEPFGAVDPINRVRLQREFREIQKRLQKTVIFVTHDVEEAMLLGDRICIMQAGGVVQLDTPERIIMNPAGPFVEQFFRGEGALTLLTRMKVRDYEEAVPCPGDPLGPEATLKEALSYILVTGDRRVPSAKGSISLERIMEAVGRDDHATHQ